MDDKEEFLDLQNLIKLHVEANLKYVTASVRVMDCGDGCFFAQVTLQEHINLRYLTLSMTGSSNFTSREDGVPLHYQVEGGLKPFLDTAIITLGHMTYARFKEVPNVP